MENEEDLVSLKEALAFIASLDATELSDSSSSSANDTDSNNSPPPNYQTTKCPKRRAKKRKRSNLSSSTRLQQRKKAELLYLRKYVQELEEKRVKLETWLQTFSQAELDVTGDSAWMNMAKDHFQARLRSETTNRTLKTMLTSQTQVIDLLHNILHKQSLSQEMDLASMVGPGSLRTSSGVSSTNICLTTEIDNINASLIDVRVACSQYVGTDMPFV
ncbi:hypothetical protein V7S43_018561 [Phytophthora oleae]|uniref:BZIP domain-containing protein n=1 Tax=Phytophthora oleae TaxID=2107226 RepID=A0ABD3EQK8_9STRA